MSKPTELQIGTFIQVIKTGGRYTAVTQYGKNVEHLIPSYALRNAHRAKMCLAVRSANTESGMQLRKRPMKEFDRARSSVQPLPSTTAEQASPDVAHEQNHAEIIEFIQNSVNLRPANYKMPDLIWKSLIRAVLRGKNIMFVGPQGTGKTMAAYAIRDAFSRPFFNIPLGSTQDPRSALIGNTHFKHGEGTFVVDSVFVRAIQTPNAIILLDELTRANPEAWNILMSVLDYKQRFLRIDEKPDTPTISVAKGVTFLATANVGHQFTATRTLDRALFDRFSVVEVQPLNKDEELDLLTHIFPDVSNQSLEAIASIAAETRKEVATEVPRLTDIVSTRQSIEMAEMIYDGFTLGEAAEVAVYPFFSSAGGSDSERTYVKQLVQRFLPTTEDDKTSPFMSSDDKLPWEA
jgi:MoxR-like ATPase